MKNSLKLIGLLMLTVWTVDSQASNYNQANWYVTVDVNQVRTTIVPLMSQGKSTEIKSALQKHLPQEVQQVSLYGNSEIEDDLSVVINGDFNTFEVNDYINSLMYLVEADKDFTVVLFDSYAYNNRLIEHYKLSRGNESKPLYSAKINDELIVLTVDPNEIESWVDNKYNSNELKSSGLVSVLVNIESAMAHVGANLGSNSQPFKSAVFNKITQFSASIYESGENLTIQSALTTADQATAKQLEQVINGLIAMNALSNLNQNNELLSAVLAGLEINNQGNDLLVSTEFALKLIAQVGSDSEKDGFDVEVTDAD